MFAYFGFQHDVWQIGDVPLKDALLDTFKAANIPIGHRNVMNYLHGEHKPGPLRIFIVDHELPLLKAHKPSYCYLNVAPINIKLKRGISLENQSLLELIHAVANQLGIDMSVKNIQVLNPAQDGIVIDFNDAETELMRPCLRKHCEVRLVEMAPCMPPKPTKPIVYERKTYRRKTKQLAQPAIP